MKVQGTPYRSIWWDEAAGALQIVDQTALPHAFRIASLTTLEEVADAIRTMRVRGAPLIGVTAAYGLAVALRQDPSPAAEERAAHLLLSTRPTAVNLRWALDRVRDEIRDTPSADKARRALESAARMADEDVDICRRIGEHGTRLANQLWQERRAEKERLHFLTHCNAGWLATVDWGTALSCVYQTHDAGIPVHVWVCETRPRSQGAKLTAWELGQHGVPHTVIPDTAAGHVLQRGLVDLCVVGSDRTTAAGDVCNKIGTYPLALAAGDNGVPFYVALPLSSVDWDIVHGIKEIPIEMRDPAEVTSVEGRTAGGASEKVAITPAGTQAVNYAFDVTPARLVTALITERGICPPTVAGLAFARGVLA